MKIDGKAPSKTRWGIKKENHPEAILAMQAARYRCQVRWVVEGSGGTEFEICNEKAVEVVYEAGPKYTAMCKACRRAVFGASPAERSAATRSIKARQGDLFAAANDTGVADEPAA